MASVPAAADRLDWDGTGKSGSDVIEFLDPLMFPDDALIRARAAESERQRQAEQERKRQEKLKRHRQMEQEREREEELKRQRRAEMERVRPGRVFRDCPACPELVVVPPGENWMGSPSNEEDREDGESPRHLVRIGSGFAVGRYEVTFAEYEAFATDTGRAHAGGCQIWTGSGWNIEPGRDFRSPGFNQTANHPVVCVSWRDANAYVDWLSRKTGKRYRLLSEAEWEYVARAGTETPFYFGSTIGTNQANYDGSKTYGPGGRTGEWRQQTVSVGGFPANKFGLHDVHGNVWEWTQDCWHHGYEGAPSDGSVWDSGCDAGSDRIVRGGSWYYEPRYLRSANRARSSADNRIIDVGFRVSRTF